MTSEDFSRPIHQLSTGIIDYINLRINHTSLLLAKRMTEITTALITVAILGSFAGLIVLLLTFAFISWYSSTVGSFTIAFLLAAGFYILIGFLLFLLREKFISDPVVRMMNRKKMFLDLKEFDHNIQIGSFDDLEDRLEYVKMNVQHRELIIEQSLEEISGNLRPAKLAAALLDYTLTSTDLPVTILTKILSFFFDKKKKKTKQKPKSSETSGHEEISQ